MTITDQPQALQTPAVDKERLRQKYLEERNKRLRTDGNDQYLQVTGHLAHYLDDPYTPVTPRAPKADQAARYPPATQRFPAPRLAPPSSKGGSDRGS